MLVFYWACFALSIIFILWFLSLGEQHNTKQTILLTVVAISNAGNVIMYLADSRHEVLTGLKLTYSSGCFLPLLIFLMICDMTHFRIPRVVKALMYLGQIGIYAVCCTVGTGTLFYKEIGVQFYNGLIIFDKHYGPLHSLFVTGMGAYFLASLIVGFLSLKKKTVVSYRNVSKLLISVGFGIFCYAFERIIHLPVELLPIVYIVSVFLSILPVVRQNTYSVHSIASEMFDDYADVGHVVFDNQLRYMGCDDSIFSIFPELSHYRMEYVLKDKGTPFTKLFLPLLKEYRYSSEDKILKTDIFEIDDKFYEYRIAPIIKRKRSQGLIIEISDVTDREKNVRLMENYSHDLEIDVEKKTEKIRDLRDKMMFGMAQMVESRDPSTGGHIRRTSTVVKIFSNELLKRDLGFDRDFLRKVERSAPMHDLGKIAVKDSVLTKNGPFLPDEYEDMKKHSAAGAVIVRKILDGVEHEDFVQIAENVAHYHHEKFNGEGYPEGLAGEDIPIEARIMAYADVFDALVSKRCYKEAYDYDRAFDIIKESVGTHFDPKLADAFMACRPQLEEFYSNDLGHSQ